ncbi:Putative esterase [hydrothermal vent metagenome]|uniref:Esterase n=1 Tax=hydrothermal vent metagenome TaxID=652676 RepID=A0A3B0T9I3_9ZZZZ
MEIFLILAGLGLLGGIVVVAVMSRRRQARIARRNARVGIDVKVDGGHINVVELGGQRRGRCFVLLHGSGANLEDLRVSLGDRLARDARVLLIDRPGHGWSDVLDVKGGETPEGQAIAINQVLNTLGADRPILVGHDVGGAVALAYALSYPEDIGGLVVLSPLSHPDRVGMTLGQRLVLLPFVGNALAWLAVPVFGRWSQGQSLARAFAPQAVPPDYYDSVAAELSLRPQTFIAGAAERASLGGFLAEQSQYYGQISVPVVIIAGEDDQTILSEDHAGRLAREVSGDRWVKLSEVGHLPHHASSNVVLFEINRLAERLWASLVER